MSRRYRVLVRKNGRECGEMSYASKSEAENAAAQIRASGTAGIEALILAPVRTENRRRNPAGRFPRSTEVQTLLFDKSRFNVTQAKTWAKAHGYKVSGTDIGGDRATKIRLRQVDPEDFAQGTFRTIEFEPGVEAVIAMPKKGTATKRGYGTRGPRRNPMAADLSSMPFEEFARHVVIGKGYNTLSGRRFVRVHSRDNVVSTDVPVSDGGKSTALKRAIDIKHRAYEQLRLHIAPGETLADRTNRRRRRRNPAMDGYEIVYEDAQGRMVREALKTKTKPAPGSWGTSVYITVSGVRVPYSKATLIGPSKSRRR